MRKLANTERIHKLRYGYALDLRIIENDEKVAYYNESESSPWFDRLSETENWSAKQEEQRLRSERIESPDTKWVFEKHLMVD